MQRAAGVLGQRFPPKPRRLAGRSAELRALCRIVEQDHPVCLALVGTGGSGKSTLAAALGHRLRSTFGTELDWFRAGALSSATLRAMLALRFGVKQRDSKRALRRCLETRPRLIVLDNHEDDAATAELLRELRGLPITWLITARRCLLGGVQIFPVTAPLVAAEAAPFPRVAALTSMLRHNPVALSIADGLVQAGVASVDTLARALTRAGIRVVQVIADEDDLPEVRELVKWAWKHLRPTEKRVLAVLAHVGGDHVDRESLAKLAPTRKVDLALERLRAFSLIQEPLEGRFALHATVRRVVHPVTELDERVLFEHYVSLLEREPGRVEAEQTHLFAAMDYAQAEGDLAARVRVAKLLGRLRV